MAYNTGSEQLTQDIATPVVFQTGAVHPNSETATQSHRKRGSRKAPDPRTGDR